MVFPEARACSCNDGMRLKVIGIVFLAMLFQPSSGIISRAGFLNMLFDLSEEQMELFTDTVTALVDRIVPDSYYGPGILSSTSVYLSDIGLRYVVILALWNRPTCNLGRGGQAQNPVVLVPGSEIVRLVSDWVNPSVESLIDNYLGYGFVIQEHVSIIYFPAIYYQAIFSQPSDNDPSGHQHGGQGIGLQGTIDLFESDNRTETSDARGKHSIPPKYASSNSSINGTSFFSLSGVHASTGDFGSDGANHTTSNTTNGTMAAHRNGDPNGDCDLPSLVLQFGFAPSVDDHNTHGVQVLNPTDKIFSPNKRFAVVMQVDCNLVLYDYVAQRSLWSSNTQNRASVCYATLTLFGELVVVDSNDTEIENPLFRTNTWCTSNGGECWTNTILEVQDDGNLVLYFAETGVPLWHSNTVQCPDGC